MGKDEVLVNAYCSMPCVHRYIAELKRVQEGGVHGALMQLSSEQLPSEQLPSEQLPLDMQFCYVGLPDTKLLLNEPLCHFFLTTVLLVCIRIAQINNGYFLLIFGNCFHGTCNQLQLRWLAESGRIPRE